MLLRKGFVRIDLLDPTFRSFGYILLSCIAGSLGNSTFNFGGKLMYFFLVMVAPFEHSFSLYLSYYERS